MIRCGLETCETTSETIKETKEEIDIKIEELLKFQYYMIDKLNDVIQKLDEKTSYNLDWRPL